MRRAIKHDAEPLTKAQLLKLLFPTHKEFVGELMEKREVEIKAEYASDKNAGDDDGMTIYREQAKLFRSMDKKAVGAGAMEETKKKEVDGTVEKKAGAASMAGKTDVYALSEEEVKKHPWLQFLADDKSELSAMV